MAIKATAQTVVCEDCKHEINPGARAFCFTDHHRDIRSAVQAGQDAIRNQRHAEPKRIREWAQRRFVMGQISRQVHEELEQCANDIEVGHG